jgi:hypothetical protein
MGRATNDSKTTFKQGKATKDWFGSYRGLTVRIVVNSATGKASWVNWYTNNTLDESARMAKECSVTQAKKLSLDVIDDGIARGGVWSRVSAENEKIRRYARR